MSDGLIFRCPGCDAEFDADLTLIGTESQCPECGIRFIVPTPTPEEGMVIAGFKLRKRLGEGGMGEVWLADQLAMSRQVAVKLLSPSLVGKEDFVKRFLHEVKMAGRLEHPNIITAFDAGQVQGFFYLAMAYVDGVELSDRLKIDHAIPEPEALRIAREIAQALDYAWGEHRILHRDIKPSNVMLDSKGHARLMDMGISKSFKDAADMTMSGAIVGTPYYISPEQGRADNDIDFRADIYSLGATLYHMVTGHFAFDAETTMQIVSKHIHQPLTSPREFNPHLSAPICALIEKMMAKSANDRQASWKNVIADIDLVLDGKMPSSAAGQPDAAVASAPTIKINFDKTMIHNPGSSSAVSSPAASGVSSGFKININTPSSKPGNPAAIASTPAAAATGVAAPAAEPAPAPAEPAIRPKLAIKTPPPSAPSSRIIPPPEAVSRRKLPLTLIFSLLAVVLFLVAGIRVFSCVKKVEKLRRVELDGTQLGAVEQVLGKLEAQAEPLLAAGKKDQAIELVLNYRGELAEESAARRRMLAEAWRKPAPTPAPAASSASAGTAAAEKR